MHVLIMTEDFNIKDNDYDLLYLHYLTYVDILREIADSFNIELSLLINQISIQYMNNSQDSNSVLDLMFLHENIEKFNNYIISLDFWSISNHTFLLVCIIIKKETIQDKKQTIIKNSKEEKEFISELRNRISCIDTTNIHDYEILEEVTQEFNSIIEKLWYKYSKYVNITKHSKA